MFIENNSCHDKKIGLCEYDFINGTYHAYDDLYTLYGMTRKGGRHDFLNFFRKIHPEDRKKLIQGVKKSLSKNVSTDMQYRIFGENNETKILKISIIPEHSTPGKSKKITGAVQDVTGHEQLSERVKILSSVVDQSPSMIGISDTNGTIIYANKAFADTTGYSMEELKGQNYSILKSGKHGVGFYKKLWSTIQAADVWRGEFINRKKSGEIYTSGAHIFPILNEAGEIINFVAMEKDITEIKRNREMVVMEEKLGQMGETIRMIAHQWRQPLHSIGSLAALIKLMLDLDEVNKHELYEYVAKINKQVQFLSSTVNDFRNFFNTNKEKDTTLASRVIKEAVEIVERSLEVKQIRLFMRVEEDSEIIIYKNEMVQVLINLIKNAEDALVEKMVEKPYVRIQVHKKNENCVIEIMDNAGGIDEEIRTKIFDPYFSTKDQQVGTGLGLYMSRIIVQDHCKGILRVENTEVGAKFTIELKGLKK